MADFEVIKATIDAEVNTNGNREITGEVLNGVLKSMVDEVNDKKQDTLVSGENIKTINNESILGSGNIDTNLRKITYAELVALRDSAGLIPGMQYRITDYITTTKAENTQSAGHAFDVIVTADDKSTLNEKARAIQHEGDEYFANSDLAAWEIWYCLDNDIERFGWADFGSVELIGSITESGTYTFDSPIDYILFNKETFALKVGEEYMLKESPMVIATLVDSQTLVIEDINSYLPQKPIEVYTSAGLNDSGKGVIYRMIDEFRNDIPYDFKNIIYVEYAGFSYFQWGSTCNFRRNSEIDKVINEVQYYGWTSADTPPAWSEPNCWTTTDVPSANMSLYKADGSQISYSGTIESIISEYSEKFTFNADGADASLRAVTHDNIVPAYFVNGKILLNNILFGDECYSNTFGLNCYSNTFGNNCYSNTFGLNCYSNTFGNNCYSNTFGSNCYSNTFGNNCYFNTFGGNCHYNTFDRDCTFNTFSSTCYSNTFGGACDSNTFKHGCNNNTFINNCGYNTFGNDCASNNFGVKCQYNTFGDECQGFKILFGGNLSQMSYVKLLGKNTNLSINNPAVTDLAPQNVIVMPGVGYAQVNVYKKDTAQIVYSDADGNVLVAQFHQLIAQ